jgi:hypothetical protein
MAWSAFGRAPAPLIKADKALGRPDLPQTEYERDSGSYLNSSCLFPNLEGGVRVRVGTHASLLPNRPREESLTLTPPRRVRSARGGPHAVLGPWWSTSDGLTFWYILDFP